MTGDALGNKASYTFTKVDRILKRPEFLHLSNYGKRVYNRHFIAIYGTGRQDRTRLGITVTKKVGGAVTRNRIKRCIREFFRTNRDSIHGILDINIIAKKAAADISQAQAYQSLRNIFYRLSSRL